MTTIQKIIKYISIAFACFLVVVCISTCFLGLYYFGALLGFDVTEESKDLKEMKLPTTNVNNIKIELGASSLTIKEGSTFKLETTTSKITAKEKDNFLVIEEESSNWFQANKKQVVLTLPNNQILQYFEIETGAGLLEIGSLKVNQLDLDLGAGKVKIDALEVYKKADIDGGTGKIIINKSKINNMELNMGVGKLTLNASVFGNSKIEAGIGNLNLNILENKELYTLKLEKGLGSIQVDGKGLENTTFGTGLNILNIEGGIGAININFKENEENL